MDGYFNHEAEFIILENGSKKLAGKFPWTEARYFQREQKGLGWALKEGLKRSTFDRVIFLPADMSYSLDFVPRALTELSNGTDLVIGSKLMPGSTVKRPLTRKMISRAYSWLNQARGLKVKDATGTKGFKKKQVLPLIEYCPSDGIEFEIQLLKAASKARLKVKEISVSVNDFRPSRFNPFN